MRPAYVTFPVDDWTASESTARLDYATASVPRMPVQEKADEVDPLPPAPHHLVGEDGQDHLRPPWAFLASLAVALALLVAVSHGFR